MADFKNISGTELTVTDEFGRKYTFAKDETKTGMSEYLEKYVDLSLLRRTSSAVDSRYAKVPAVRNENMVFVPGTTYKGNGMKIGGVDTSSDDADRGHYIVWDCTNDTAGRQIATEFCGINQVSTDPTTSSPNGIYLNIDDGTMFIVFQDDTGAKTLKEVTLT